jgi:succinate dehydrogenase/fumarate reductase flavoprotein subunit
VFGKRAGCYSAKRALDNNHLDVDWDQVEEEFNSILKISANEQTRGLRPFEIRRTVQNLMWGKVSFFKNAEDLNIALRKFERIREEELPKMYTKSRTNIYDYDLVEAVETYHMLETAEMIARASLLREESRGAHQREDYPETDNRNWLSNIYIRTVDSKMILEKRPIIATEIAAEEIIKSGI